MAQAVPRAPTISSPSATMAGRPWWLQPAVVAAVLGVFSVYVIWAALQGAGYVAPYLSPLYSPRLPGLGPIPGPFLVLWAPLGFRATCYYYRKAYYRSFFWDPPACARPELRGVSYGGERRFPFVLNNLHRYFLVVAVIVLIFLWSDTVRAFHFAGHFGVGLGSLLFLVNVVFLSLYTFSCHSLRHLVGGGVACFSCAAAGGTRHTLWRWVSFFNPKHPAFAWWSLLSVWGVDLYVRLLLAGIVSDPHWVL